MAEHPRYKYFPWQADYSAQANLFAPYAMAVAQPGFRSKALNVDALGYRHQYDGAGRLIDLRTARSTYAECDLLLGNSTAFGVSLTQDHKSLGHYLGQAHRPCINLSVRGATMQQELAIYLTYKHLLPPPRRIVLLTGICDVSLATQPEDWWSGEVGGMHVVDTFYKQHYRRAQAMVPAQTQAKNAFQDWAEDQYHKRPWLQRVFERRMTQDGVAPALSQDAVRANLDLILPLMQNVLETWGWIAKATGIDVQIVLQPVLGWTGKRCSKIELECIDADIERIPVISLYANQIVHAQIDSFFRQSCVQNGLAYVDANSFFDVSSMDATLFCDICHLTDAGTKWLADGLNRNDVASLPGG